MTLTNRQIRRAARPVGMPKDSDWNLTEKLRYRLERSVHHGGYRGDRRGAAARIEA